MKTISLFGLLMNFCKSVSTRINNFFDDWAKDMVKAEKEWEERTKVPLAVPCPHCGGGFSIERYLPIVTYPATDFSVASLGSPALNIFQGQNMAIRVCSGCRTPL